MLLCTKFLKFFEIFINLFKFCTVVRMIVFNSVEKLQTDWKVRISVYIWLTLKTTSLILAKSEYFPRDR